jgi:pyruvate dehydrogenase E2 component (dihydrolipoamide acetyltransferase)
MRRTIAERLGASFYTAPHYYLTVSADVGALMEGRKRLAGKTGDPLSFNAILIKLAAQALKKHPRVNAAWEDEGVRQFARQDIGLAVALKEGLITPVVRHAGLKGLQEIDKELSELIVKARDAHLSPEEYSGATFTISNLGAFGIEEFTAIINPPGSAILAVGAAVPRVVPAGNGGFETRTLMKMTLSCDHRVIDGAVGAAFLAELKQMIEEPLGALL